MIDQLVSVAMATETNERIKGHTMETTTPVLDSRDISDCKSANEVLESLGLDKPYTTERELYGYKGYKGIVDPNGKRLCIVNDSYDLLQPREAFELMHPTVERFGGTYNKATFLQGGRQLVISAKIGSTEIARADRRKGDVIETSINFFTSFDGSKQSDWALQLLRVWCANGCASWEKLVTMSVKHTKQQRSRFDEIRAKFDSIDNVGGSTLATMQRLTAQAMSVDQAKLAIEEVIGGTSSRSINNRETLLGEFHNEKRGTFGQTAFDMLNAFTAYQTHEATYRATASTSRSENQLTATIFGQSATQGYLRAIENALAA